MVILAVVKMRSFVIWWNWFACSPVLVHNVAACSSDVISRVEQDSSTASGANKKCQIYSVQVTRQMEPGCYGQLHDIPLCKAT